MTAIVDGPALLVTPRQAYLLSRAADLGRLRLQVRGQVAELDEVLFGLAALAARWEPHLVADAGHGPGHDEAPCDDALVMTAAEVARHANCSGRTVRRAAADDRLVGTLTTAGWVFTPTAVRDWMANRQEAT